MDRKSFLDAQLWLEKVDEPKDPWGKTIRNFASNHGSISLFPILIKSSPETINSQPVQDEEETNEQSVVPAFCCFHVGNRFCFFRSNEKDQDQSQLVFELALIEKEQVLLLEEDKENSQHSGEGDGSCSNIMQAGMYARFDRKYTYLIDMGQIKKLLFPSSSSSANTPPFICFEFPNVMLRVWLDMDKCENNESARCGLKNALIHLQQSHLMRKKRFHETQQIPLQAKHPCEWRTLLLKKSPNVTKRWVSAKEFVNKASNVLDTNSMSALHEMIQSYKQKGIPSQEDGSSQEEKKQEEIFMLADSQIIELIGALILHFRQLSVSHQDIQDVIDTLFDFHSLKRCDRHDQCFQLPVSPSASPVCVTSLWHAWDEFLDASNVSQLSSDPATLQATIEHAAIAFRNAVPTKEVGEKWKVVCEQARKELDVKEEQVLNVLFPPIKKIWLLPKKQQKQLHQEHDNTVATLTASTVVTKENEKSIKKKRLKVGDELLKYFKEKRKKLIRDEITFSLLPSRTIVE